MSNHEMTDSELEAIMTQVVEDEQYLTNVRPELTEFAHRYAVQTTNNARHLDGDLLEALYAIRLARPNFDIARVAGYFG